MRAATRVKVECIEYQMQMWSVRQTELCIAMTSPRRHDVTLSQVCRSILEGDLEDDPFSYSEKQELFFSLKCREYSVYGIQFHIIIVIQTSVIHYLFCGIALDVRYPHGPRTSDEQAAIHEEVSVIPQIMTQRMLTAQDVGCFQGLVMIFKAH